MVICALFLVHKENEKMEVFHLKRGLGVNYSHKTAQGCLPSIIALRSKVNFLIDSSVSSLILTVHYKNLEFKSWKLTINACEKWSFNETEGKDSWAYIGRLLDLLLSTCAPVEQEHICPLHESSRKGKKAFCL